MEKPVPMDRLICGDVGYGKTEIAVRAAFKAVQDGKQVAVLVPTTLLVQQHLETFTERYANFPVVVQALSRFQTDAEAAAVRDGPDRDGTVDVVIGTHRLLTGEVQVQGPRPGRGRRGAAVRRRAQGAAEAAAHQRRRAGDERDADPAHAGDGGHRHPRDVDPRHPAGGAAPGADLRRPLRREADHRRDPARAAARGPGLLHPQPGRVDRAGGRPAARAGAGGADRRRARPDGRAPARAGDRRLLGEAVRRAGLHDDRRDRAGHLQRQHAHRRAGRPARAVPAAPAARPGRPRPGAGVRVLPLPAGAAAHRDRATTGCRRSRSTPTSAPACTWR